MSSRPDLSPEKTEQMEEIIQRMLCKNLSLEHWCGNDGSVIVQLKLGDKEIGKTLRLSIDWRQDHGHGGGSYVNGLTLD